MHDLRCTLRQLWKNPGFTSVAVFTLALGIGANTVVMSWIRSTLLNSIPGAAEPSRLVVVAPVHPEAGVSDTMSLADIEALRGPGSPFERIAGSQIDVLGVREGPGQPVEWIWGQPVEAGFFDVVGVQPALGRFFQPGEDHPGAAEGVVVISHRYWQRRFGGAPNVLGRVLDLNERPVTVVGVAPPEFRGTMGGLELDIWAPLPAVTSPAALRQRAESHGWRWLHTVARLRDGISRDEAAATAAAIAARIAQDHPRENRDTSFAVLPLWESPWGGQEIFLPLLRVLAVVALLLFGLVMANIANLLLARAQSREGEVAVRLALGASPIRILSQFLGEGLVLAVLGGVFGVALARLGAHALLGLMPPTYLPIAYDFPIDVPTLAATSVLTLGAGLLVGLLPAWHALQLPVHDTLKDAGRTASWGGSKAWLRRALVVSEIAVACVLLVGMGLCVRSFQKAQHIDLGLEPSRVWLAGYRVGAEGADRAWVNGIFRRLRAEAAGIPGVQSVALADWVPLGFEDGSGTGVELPGYQPRPGESMASRLGFVSPDFFKTLGIPLISGREFRDGDGDEAVRPVVVNQAFVDRYFPGREPLGLAFRASGADAQIVGVVRTGKYRSLNEAPFPYVYMPAESVGVRDLTLVVKTEGEPESVARAVEQLSASVDSRLTPFAGLSYERYMAAALAIPRVAAVLLSTLAVVALGLAALGTYAVVSQAARQRQREMGVRLALGARRADIIRLILNQGVTMAALGVGLGFLGSLGAAGAVAGVLVGVRASDAVSWILPPVLLVLVTVFACWWPARRASRVDPMVALREG